MIFEKMIFFLIYKINIILIQYLMIIQFPVNLKDSVGTRKRRHEHRWQVYTGG